MITTSNEDLAEKCKNIRNHGDRVSDVDYFCFNFRMSELNALIGLLQMPRLTILNDWQIRNAERIIRELPSFLKVPPTPNYATTVRYIVGCLCEDAEKRQNFLKKLCEKGWDGGVPRMNIGGGWSKLVCDVKFYHKPYHHRLPMSEMLRDTAVWIDWHRYPRTGEEIDLMLEHIKEATP